MSKKELVKVLSDICVYGYHHSSKDIIKYLAKTADFQFDPELQANLGSGIYFSPTSEETGFGKDWVEIELCGDFLVLDELQGMIELKKIIGGRGRPFEFRQKIIKAFKVDGLIFGEPTEHNSGVFYNTEKIRVVSTNIEQEG